jgi:hypothetical protein
LELEVIDGLEAMFEMALEKKQWTGGIVLYIQKISMRQQMNKIKECRLKNLATWTEV